MSTTKDRAQALNTDVSESYSALQRFGAKRARNLGIAVAVLVVASIYVVQRDGFSLFVQRVFDGLNNGFIYAAVALALVLIYKATGIVNFAQGEMAMLGTFIAYVLIVENSLPTWLGILVAMVISGVLAAGIERVLIRPFDPGNHLGITIVTLGLFLGLNALAGVIWGFDPRAFPTPFPGAADDYVDIFGARMRFEALGIWVTVAVVVLLVTLLLKRTKVGLAFRAVSNTLESSRLVGIHIGRTLQFGWALAAAVGTLAGCLVARVSFLDPSFMGRVLIFSFAAATLGGLDSLGGAIAGGIIVGLLQTMIGGYVEQIGGDLSLVVALAVIVVILVLRPNGLFGSKRVERV